MGACSGAICWYCERKCESAAEAGGKAATVDHFRPLSRFPELAYEWSNWIFSCQECNGEYKKDKWAGGGYVDPGAGDEQARPEWYFAYDTRTGDIIAHPTLTGETRQRAWDTISDMGLNRLNVQYYRLNWTRQLEADLLQLPSDERNAFAEFVSGRAAEFLGSTRMLIAQMRESGEF